MSYPKKKDARKFYDVHKHQRIEQVKSLGPVDACLHA